MFNYADDAMKYAKGSIYWADLPYSDGSGTRGRRPVVIVSGLKGTLISPVVTVVPLTTKVKDFPCNLTLNFRINPDLPSQALCNQITTIDKKSLLGYVGQLPNDDLMNLNKTVLESLGFPISLIEDVESKMLNVQQIKQEQEALAKLIPEAKDILKQLTAILARVAPEQLGEVASTATSTPEPTTKTRKVIKRSPEQIRAFCKDWENTSNKAEVAQKYNFSGTASAKTFYNRHRR